MAFTSKTTIVLSGRQNGIRYSSYQSTESSLTSSSPGDSCSDDCHGEINKLCSDLDSFNFRTIDHFDDDGKLKSQVEECVRSVTRGIDLTNINYPAIQISAKKTPGLVMHKPIPPRDGTKAHKPWMTHDTLRMIRIRDMLKASLAAHGSADDHIGRIQYEMFKKARNSIVTLCRNARADYFEAHPEEHAKWEAARKAWSERHPSLISRRGSKQSEQAKDYQIDYTKRKVWKSQNQWKTELRSEESECWRQRV